MGAYGLKAIHPNATATDDDPHIVGFATPRSTAGLKLFSARNGDNSGTEKFSIDKDGNTAISGALTIPTAGIKFAGDTTIKATTSDGSDNASLQILGGGAIATSRGASIEIGGNESLTRPGAIFLQGGNVANGWIQAYGATGVGLCITNTNQVMIGTNDNTNVGTGSLRIAGAIQVGDGIAAPNTQAGFASIYVDTADGDLKVKFGDGTVKTISVDT